MAIDLDHETNTIGATEGTGTVKLARQTEALDSFTVQSTDVSTKPSLIVKDYTVDNFRIQITPTNIATWNNPGGGANSRAIYTYWHLRMQLQLTQFLHAANARFMTLPESASTGGFLITDDVAYNPHAKLRYNTDLKDTELQLPRATDPTNNYARYPLAWRVALTTAQRQALDAGDLRVGQEVYDTTRNKLYIWDGTRWRISGTNHPGYINGRWYAAYEGVTAGGGQTANTQYVYPYFVREPINIAGLGWDSAVLPTTGNIKGAIYRHDYATGRPTGTPVVASNNAIAMSALPTSDVFAGGWLEPDLYWFCTWTDASPSGQLVGTSGTSGVMASIIGTSVQADIYNQTLTGLSRVLTYPADIRTVDVAGVAWLNQNSSAVPIIAMLSAN
jgi:hypothetical protein